MKERFTPAEANRTLPLVRRIVVDVLERGRELRSLAAGPRNQTVNDRIWELEHELMDLMREFKKIGCTYKDFGFESGLVDFPSNIEGRDVLLCWKSDEPSVSHYHGFEDGFAGRRPIPPELLSEE